VSPFGFHYSIGGNKTGVGQFIDKLNAAGIPVMMKGASDAGLCFEAQEKGKQYGVENTLIWRATSGREDRADYWLAPSEAAAKKWSEIRPLWPPELDPALVWWEVINEPRKEDAPDEVQPTWGNMHTTAWLGLFLVELARLMNAAGYKICGPSFSSGEPEPEDWQLEGMASWLRYCAEHPEQAAVTHHEYNYGSVPFLDNYPWHYGRFQAIIAAADLLDIPRTFKIFLTEMGWQERNVPSWETAVPVLAEYARLGARFPQLAGLALWTLQVGWGDISNQLAAWISNQGNPLASWVINNQYPELPQPQATAAEFGATLPEETPMTKHKAIVVKLPQDMTDEEWRTAADAAFPFRHTMTASHDDMLTILNGGSADSFVKFSHPERDFVAVEMVELAGYAWQQLYATPPTPLEIINIVDELPKHATLKYATRPLDAITTLTIHHTVSPPDRSIESLAAYHVASNGWPGIGYHFVLKADGRIFQTNHLTTKSYHAGSAAAPGDENLFSVGIALQGDFTNAPPPQAQLDAARDLVAHLLATLPKATAVLGHRQMPGAATACPGATWQQWLPYVAGGEIVKPDPPPPPPPPVGQLVDMTQYYLPPNGRTYGDISIKPTNWGQGDVRQQLQLHGGYLFVTKGNEFEKRMILDGRIYFLMDDSPGDGKYYTVNSPTGWIPGQWRVGETFARQEVATFYYKSSCQPTGEVNNWSNQMLFKAFYPEWTSPHGLKLTNVAHLQWLVNGTVEEDYYLAPGLGYAGWKNRHGRESWIKELIPHTDQQPNKFYGSCYHAPFG
jgi:hypothetical protein